jgi:hypothetical protein
MESLTQTTKIKISEDDWLLSEVSTCFFETLLTFVIDQCCERLYSLKADGFCVRATLWQHIVMKLMVRRFYTFVPRIMMI